MSEQDIRYLQQIELFQGLPPADLAAIAKVAQGHRVKQGELFFRQGEPTTTLYVLIRGRIRLTQVTPEGHQVILRIIGPGEMFGLIAALGEASYPVSAQAVDDCLALGWDGETMAHLMERYTRLAFNAMHLLAARVKEFQDRYRELATERVERRVARALLRLARHSGKKVEGGVLIDLPLSRQNLAEMSGTTLYTVSRILSQWEQEDIIEAGRERVLIRSPHGLVIIAEDLPPGTPLEDTSET